MPAEITAGMEALCRCDSRTCRPREGRSQKDRHRTGPIGPVSCRPLGSMSARRPRGRNQSRQGHDLRAILRRDHELDKHHPERIVASMTAANPEGMYCSAKAKALWQPPNRRTPLVATDARARRVGIPGLRNCASPSRIAPATMERTPIIRNGGVDFTASAIARYVDPHRTYTAAKAASRRPRRRTN
jgi:hypothetical protein